MLQRYGSAHLAQGTNWVLAAASSGSGEVALPAAVGFAGAHSMGQVFLLVLSVLPFVTLSGRNSGLMYIIERQKILLLELCNLLNLAFS